MHFLAHNLHDKKVSWYIIYMLREKFFPFFLAHRWHIIYVPGKKFFLAHRLCAGKDVPLGT
jgi:hypothetical protein